MSCFGVCMAFESNCMLTHSVLLFHTNSNPLIVRDQRCKMRDIKFQKLSNRLDWKCFNSYPRNVIHIYLIRGLACAFIYLPPFQRSTSAHVFLISRHNLKMICFKQHCHGTLLQIHICYYKWVLWYNDKLPDFLFNIYQGKKLISQWPVSIK